MIKAQGMPFSISKRKGRTNYYVQFKDSNGHYMSAISTGTASKVEALAVAFQWLKDGIPVKTKSPKDNHLINVSLKSAINAVQSIDDAEYVCSELQKRGLLKSYALAGSMQSQGLVSFLEQFWDYDNSAYLKEKARRGRPIHKSYVLMSLSRIKNYWLPYFKDTMLCDVTVKSIDNFIESLPSNLAGGSKNLILKAGIIPLRYAYSKGVLTTDVTKSIVWFSKASQERQILTPDIVIKLFKLDWDNEKAKLGNLLAALTGLRIDEIIALQYQDIGEGCLFIKHSYNKLDGLKLTKTNTERIVELPFPSVLKKLRVQCKSSPWGVSDTSFIFWSHLTPNAPMTDNTIRNSLYSALEKLGLPHDKIKSCVFHSWRHFYATYMKDKLDSKLLQSQTGHKSLAMLEHYSSHEAIGDRQKIINAELEVFGSMLKAIGTDSVLQEDASI